MLKSLFSQLIVVKIHQSITFYKNTKKMIPLRYLWVLKFQTVKRIRSPLIRNEGKITIPVGKKSLTEVVGFNPEANERVLQAKKARKQRRKKFKVHKRIDRFKGCN